MPERSDFRSPTDASIQIEVNSFYELDHSKLPLGSPQQLQSSRIVMVSARTELNVVVRYPSNRSSTACSSLTIFTNLEFYNEFSVELGVARKLLLRRISSEEFLKSNNLNRINPPEADAMEVVSRKGMCWHELKKKGMLRWSARRRVHFISRSQTNHHRNSNYSSSPQTIEQKALTESKHQTSKRRYCKRKGGNKFDDRNRSKLTSPQKIENPVHRWSPQRYNTAERVMFEIMKEKGAILAKPILRQELRTEARKKIGDTGLLDHLLKHMAGRVSADGNHRFRRRHNVDGVMEYWLESTELVQDPSGRNDQDEDVKKLREEVVKIKRIMEELILGRKREENDSGETDVDEEFRSSMPPLKKMHAMLVKRRAKIEQQLIEVTGCLGKIEVEMQAISHKASEQVSETPMQIQSGFRLCKPHGTFLWPSCSVDTTPFSPPSRSPPAISVTPEPLPESHRPVPSPSLLLKPVPCRFQIRRSTAALPELTRECSRVHTASVNPAIDLNEIPATPSPDAGKLLKNERT